jgi:hypothetical protein
MVFLGTASVYFGRIRPLGGPRKRWTPACAKHPFAEFFENEPLRSNVLKKAFVRMMPGWDWWLRIYSREQFGYFEVPVEEFNEAHLSAQSSQEG